MPKTLSFRMAAEALGSTAWTQRPGIWEIVCPLGEPPPNDEREWLFEERDLDGAAEQFNAQAEPLPVYYAHGKDIVKGSRAAGWIHELKVIKDAARLATITYERAAAGIKEPEAVPGLYAFTRYTDEALGEIRAGFWGFRSPGYDGFDDANGKHHLKTLYEYSLVNEPAIGGMPALAANKEGSLMTEPNKETAAAVAAALTAAKKTAAGASFDKGGLLTTIRDAFGIPDAVNDKVLSGMIEDALGGAATEDPAKPDPNAAPDPFASLNLGAEKIGEGLTAAKGSTLSEKVQNFIATGIEHGMAATERKQRVVRLVASACEKLGEEVRESAMKLASKDPDAYEAHLSALPRRVPEGGSLLAGKRRLTANSAPRDVTDMSVDKDLLPAALAYQAERKRAGETVGILTAARRITAG
jgi:hypothetical protein